MIWGTTGWAGGIDFIRALEYGFTTQRSTLSSTAAQCKGYGSGHDSGRGLSRRLRELHRKCS